MHLASSEALASEPRKLKAEKNPMCYRKSRKIREKLRTWGLGGLEVISFVNIMKRIAQKLRKTILLHFGLVTFRFHYWKTRKVIICMVSGPGGRDHDSPNQLFLIVEAPRLFKRIQEKQITFKHDCFGKYENLESWNCWKCVFQYFLKLGRCFLICKTLRV